MGRKKNPLPKDSGTPRRSKTRKVHPSSLPGHFYPQKGEIVLEDEENNFYRNDDAFTQSFDGLLNHLGVPSLKDAGISITTNPNALLGRQRRPGNLAG